MKDGWERIEGEEEVWEKEGNGKNDGENIRVEGGKRRKDETESDEDV